MSTPLCSTTIAWQRRKRQVRKLRPLVPHLGEPTERQTCADQDQGPGYGMGLKVRGISRRRGRSSRAGAKLRSLVHMRERVPPSGGLAHQSTGKGHDDSKSIDMGLRVDGRSNTRIRCSVSRRL